VLLITIIIYDHHIIFELAAEQIFLYYNQEKQDLK